MCKECRPFAVELRELQRAAMESMLRDMEYEQRPDGGWRGVAWNELKPHYVDKLLDEDTEEARSDGR